MASISIYSFSQWRYVHLLFFVAFLGSWFLFALLWWLIIYYHGDFEEEHLPANQVSAAFSTFPINTPLPWQEANNWTPCVWQINNFASVFLFRCAFYSASSTHCNHSVELLV